MFLWCTGFKFHVVKTLFMFPEFASYLERFPAFKYCKNNIIKHSVFIQDLFYP